MAFFFISFALTVRVEYIACGIEWENLARAMVNDEPG